MNIRLIVSSLVLVSLMAFFPFCLSPPPMDLWSKVLSTKKASQC